MWWSNGVVALLEWMATAWLWIKVLLIVALVLGFIAVAYWLDHVRFIF